MEEFRVYWLGKEKETLGTYLLERDNIQKAINATCQRYIQSNTLVPIGAVGFIVQSFYASDANEIARDIALEIERERKDMIDNMTPEELQQYIAENLK